MKDNFKVQQNINSVPNVEYEEVTLAFGKMPAKFKIPKWIVEDRKLSKLNNDNIDNDSKEV